MSRLRKTYNNKLKKMPDGGLHPKPIYTTNRNDPRLRSYNDSLDLYNLSKNVSRIWPNLPKISMAEFNEIQKKEANLDEWNFDQVQYQQDKKKGIAKNLDQYVYSRKRGDYNHPIYLKNNKKELDKYTDNISDFAIRLPDGRIKYPGYVYNGRPDYNDYSIEDPTGTTRRYSKYNGKSELTYISSPKINPIFKNYYGSSKLIPVGGIETSSSLFINNKLQKQSLDKYKNYIMQTESADVYAKPVQPVIYGKGDSKQVGTNRGVNPTTQPVSTPVVEKPSIAPAKSVSLVTPSVESAPSLRQKYKVKKFEDTQTRGGYERLLELESGETLHFPTVEDYNDWKNNNEVDWTTAQIRHNVPYGSNLGDPSDIANRIDKAKQYKRALPSQKFGGLTKMPNGGKFLPTAVAQKLETKPSKGLREAYKRRKRI